MATTATCAWSPCGKTFTVKPSGHSPTGRTIYCSKSCSAKATNHARYEGKSKANGAGRKAATRRRRMVVATTWDGVTDDQILERDRWMCWICKRRIGKTFKFPHPRSASIDHLIPLALGGDDTAFNKKAAHLGCNMTRQTGKADEHPMLNFSLDPDIEIKPRERGKSCAICGEIPGSRCKLHMPVWYVTCQACGVLSVARTKAAAARATCGTPECKRRMMYARHDQAVSKRDSHKRGLQAHALHEQGMTWDEVADRLGYSASNIAAAAAARATGKRSRRKTGEYARVPRAGKDPVDSAA